MQSICTKNHLRYASSNYDATALLLRSIISFSKICSLIFIGSECICFCFLFFPGSVYEIPSGARKVGGYIMSSELPVGCERSAKNRVSPISSLILFTRPQHPPLPFMDIRSHLHKNIRVGVCAGRNANQRKSINREMSIRPRKVEHCFLKMFRISGY